MRESGALLFSEKYSHRYPHCWRCKNPVIYRATPQWFISMDAVAKTGSEISLRDNALAHIEKVNWHPAWGEDRMRNMFKGRPDWCVSRQRSWGVPIPVFYCQACDEPVADKKIVDHVADIFEVETADAWYNRPESELLPEGFVCPKCKGADFRKETDILDVWFDSGSSCVAVLETRGETLRFPADLYLEGGDQFRGWFNSSLMCGLAAHDQAPYKEVVTYGWVVDGEGKPMHKSGGNAVSPRDFMNESGADVMRLWAAAADTTKDVRWSKEILDRVIDAYRKFRNTLRYALGNVAGFNAEADSVPESEMLEIDRWALASLDDLTAKVLKGYEAYDFQAAYHALYHFCTVTLSARYFDIIKDRLYILAPKSLERRSAQTALYRIADSLCRLLAPILVFTSDEAWENLPHRDVSSVHIAEFPQVDDTDYSGLLENWRGIFAIRDDVLRRLETARNDKQIGSSLEAKVVLTAGAATTRFLLDFFADLRYIFIVSQVEVHEVGPTGEIHEIVAESKPGNQVISGKASIMTIKIEKADGEKCERCWNYSVRIGEFDKYPTVCERCFDALNEIEKAAAA